MRSPNCLLLFLPLLVSFLLFNSVSSAEGGGQKGPLVGGWLPIKDVNDTHVQEIGKFAVTEHNKEAKTELAYESVVEGQTQVVAGVNYRLVIAAKDGGNSENYEAVVWEKSWESYMNLTSFKRLLQG